MKPKPRQKLVVRRDTLRQLNDLELTRAHGGGGPVVAFESETTCVTHAGVPNSAACIGR
jgi:hypothetical protein